MMARSPPPPPPVETPFPPPTESSSSADLDFHAIPPPSPFFPFHLLEITVISAQDLFPAVKSAMRAYAVAWVDPSHKLRTRLDPAGHVDPTWNDKFVFRVDDPTLRSPTAAVTVEVYADRPHRRDLLIGTSRAVLSTLRPSQKTRFAALQVRRPTSLRPQGILNVGVALLDAIVRKGLPLNYGDAAFAESYKAAEKEEEEVVRPKKLEKSRSARAVEAKLERWRTELPAVKDEEGEEKGKGRGRGRGLSRRTVGKISCFSNLAGEGKGGGKEVA